MYPTTWSYPDPESRWLLVRVTCGQPQAVWLSLTSTTRTSVAGPNSYPYLEYHLYPSFCSGRRSTVFLTCHASKKSNGRSVTASCQRFSIHRININGTHHCPFPVVHVRVCVLFTM